MRKLLATVFMTFGTMAMTAQTLPYQAPQLTDVVALSPTAVLSAAERVSIKFSGSGLAGESSVQAANINIVKSSSWAKQDDLPPPITFINKLRKLFVIALVLDSAAKLQLFLKPPKETANFSGFTFLKIQ